jgi:Starter unit:ACP transacylase in aflatoxin biosynthesis
VGTSVAWLEDILEQNHIAIFLLSTRQREPSTSISTSKQRLNAALKLVDFVPPKSVTIMRQTRNEQPAGARPQRIVLFGGQGSRGLSSTHLAKITEEVIKCSATAAILLSRCHAAFLEELLELSSEVGQSLGIDPTHFHSPGDLLSPRPQYHTHGIIQSSTICLYQLLHYLAEIEREKLSIETTLKYLSEATGLCSGMIPAIVIASSQTEEQFLNFGVGALRLSFWVGWRAIVKSRQVDNSEAEDGTWSLVISGLSRSQVERHIDDFYHNVSYVFKMIDFHPFLGTHIDESRRLDNCLASL